MKRLKLIFICLIMMITVFAAAGCTESPYDVAVRNGFEGTEEQWIQSLKGKDGADGADLKIEDIYNFAVAKGFEGNYDDFLHEYLSFTQTSDNSQSINKSMRSAMIIYCTYTSRSNSFYQSGQEYAQAGAGVIYKLNKDLGSAYIITNYHVVYASNSSSGSSICDEITVYPYDGEEISATYVGGSADYDIAVLRAQGEYFKSDFPLAVTVNKNDIMLGQTVIAIGNPAGYGLSATQGIVSVESEYITMNAIDDSTKKISSRVTRIDAAVNSGNSGGGLFNTDGELVGIVNAKASDNSIENIGYAIPVSIATAVADNILANSTFKKGTVGISISSRDSSASIDENGLIHLTEVVYIASVSGAASGILQEGDIILSVTLNGEERKVTRQYHVPDLLLSSKSGDVVTFKIKRAGSELTLDVTCA